MKPVWTKLALKTYFNVLDYLEEEWGQQCVKSFTQETERTIHSILKKPKMFHASKKNPNTYKALITKHNYLIYQVKPRKKEIVLLLFWDTRQNPSKLNY